LIENIPINRAAKQRITARLLHAKGLVSNFSDRIKYNGYDPNGSIFLAVCGFQQRGIADFISNRNKVAVTGLCVDTTYYITKILAKSWAKMYDGLLLGDLDQSWAHSNQSYVNGWKATMSAGLWRVFVESQQVLDILYQ
jgi:hypothetical protein